MEDSCFVHLYLVSYTQYRVSGNTRSVRKVSSHFEHLENRSRGLGVTWQPVREDLTVHS